jgi:hypothetical protein
MDMDRDMDMDGDRDMDRDGDMDRDRDIDRDMDMDRDRASHGCEKELKALWLMEMIRIYNTYV